MCPQGTTAASERASWQMMHRSWSGRDASSCCELPLLERLRLRLRSRVRVPESNKEAAMAALRSGSSCVWNSKDAAMAAARSGSAGCGVDVAAAAGTMSTKPAPPSAAPSMNLGVEGAPPTAISPSGVPGPTEKESEMVGVFRPPLGALKDPSGVLGNDNPAPRGVLGIRPPVSPRGVLRNRPGGVPGATADEIPE